MTIPLKPSLARALLLMAMLPAVPMRRERNDRASRTCFASARPAWVILLALLVVGCESPCKEHIVGDGWNTANFCTRSDHVIEVVDGHTVCRCPRKDGGR